MLSLSSFSSPLGIVRTLTDERSLYAVSIDGEESLSKLGLKYAAGNTKAAVEVERELRRYFDGEQVSFSTPLDPPGTDFQKKVWRAMSEIPFGSTVTYAELAVSAGFERRYARATANAVGANPIVVILPCHRVVASDGLGGFGCGVDKKIWLLKHEKSIY